MQKSFNFTRQMFRASRPSPMMFRMMAVPTTRMFGHTKYQFDDEDWQPNVYQLSQETHQTNAEELINSMPIIEVKGNQVRCTGVQELGLGHPVQYI